LAIDAGHVSSPNVKEERREGVGSNLNTDRKPMLRVATLAAVAVVLAAAAPASAESIHISTAGKSADQLKAEVYKAASELCHAEVGASSLSYYLQRPCVRSTVTAALKEAKIPSLTEVASR
jgi:hypothetical protein